MEERVRFGVAWRKLIVAGISVLRSFVEDTVQVTERGRMVSVVM